MRRMKKMAEEIIRFGAGGVPYKPITPPEVPEVEVVEVVEAPVVSVEITEKEGLGDIPKRKKKDENV